MSDFSAIELLRQLNETDETVTLEAKQSREVGRSLLETVCSFANEPGLGGGHILVGVKPAPGVLWPTYEVETLHNLDQLQSRIATECNTVFNRPIRPEIRIESIGDKNVIVVRIQEVAPGEKPVFFNSDGLPKGAYRRIGPTDHKCSSDDLLLFALNRQNRTFDEEVVADAELEDIDPQALDRYRSLRRAANSTAEELMWSNEDLLIALSCAKRVETSLRPTVAGILLFGKAIAIRRLFPAMRIDYLRVPGTDWVPDPDRRFETTEILAPLIFAIPRIHAAVIDDLPKGFRLPPGELRGQEVPSIPQRVIREALVNAIMHRDYRQHMPVQVIRYANRLEIRNPGYSLVSEDQLGQPGSHQRNPKLSAVLHDISFAETKGSGIRVMLESMREANLTPPFFESLRDAERFVVTLLFHHFLGKDDVEWLSRFKIKLDDSDARTLVFLREMKAINNSAYRSQNHVDTLTASARLRRLCELNIIEMKGRGRDTYYVPGPLFEQVESEASQVEPGARQVEQGASQVEPGASQVEPETLPNWLANMVNRISGKSGKRILKRAVLNLCSWKELGTFELGHYVGRNEKYLRDTIVSELVDSGDLEFTTKTKTDPNLKYRTTPHGTEWLEQDRQK